MADRVIVLTGGIGSGKSEAAAMFQELDITVVDADAISYQLTASGGAAMPAIREAFGPQAISADGAMDRAYMRQAAFSNPRVRKTLESILHPMIAQRAREILRRAPGAYAIYAVPLWIEKYGSLKPREQSNPSVAQVHPGLVPQALVVVDCDDETRIARVTQRSGLSRQDILAIMASQVSREERLAAADAVLDNSGSLDALRQQVLDLHQRLIRP